MFMATERLVTLEKGTTNPPRTPAQDVESFLWVLLYAVYKNAIDECGDEAASVSQDALEVLKESFFTLFLPPSATKLRIARSSYVRNEGNEHTALLRHANARSSKGRNFYAVVQGVLVALEKYWNPEPWMSEASLRLKAWMTSELSGDEVKITSPSQKRVLTYEVALKVLGFYEDIEEFFEE